MNDSAEPTGAPPAEAMTGSSAGWSPRPFETIPTLGVLATLASLASLGLNRVLIRALSGQMPHVELVRLSRWGALVRNLAAIACLVAVSLAIVDFLRTRDHLPVRRRLVLAAFSGIFLPVGALAILMPPANATVQIVLFGTGAAHVLTVLLGSVALRSSAAPLGLRIGAGLMAIAAFFALGNLMLAILGPALRFTAATVISSWLRRTGEVAYLLTPLAIAAAVFPSPRTPRGKIAFVASGVVAVVVFVSFVVARTELRANFDVVLYGAQRVEMLLGTTSLAYAFPLSLGFAIAAGALVGENPANRQAGAGILLWLAGGYAPHSAGHLLMMVLAIALVVRAMLARGDAEPEIRREEALRRINGAWPPPPESS